VAVAAPCRHASQRRAGALQVAAKVVKAGTADNQTIYIVGLGFRYREHNASIEISDDGLYLNGAALP
jgi:hypothetical protein